MRDLPWPLATGNTGRTQFSKVNGSTFRDRKMHTHNSLSGTIGMGVEDGSRIFPGPVSHQVLRVKDE